MTIIVLKLKNMKKIAIFSFITLATIVMISACKAKTAENTNPEQTKDTVAAVMNLTPENMVALVDADWDAVPQEVLDAMGVKALNSFKKEVKDAQVDNMQYYFGKDAVVELDAEGKPVKIADDNENAVVIHLTAESVAYGTIAFRNEADYNEFMNKANTVKENKDKAGEELEMEFSGLGKNTEAEVPGFEKDKWFLVNFTSNK